MFQFFLLFWPYVGHKQFQDLNFLSGTFSQKRVSISRVYCVQIRVFCMYGLYREANKDNTVNINLNFAILPILAMCCQRHVFPWMCLSGLSTGGGGEVTGFSCWCLFGHRAPWLDTSCDTSWLRSSCPLTWHPETTSCAPDRRKRQFEGFGNSTVFWNLNNVGKEVWQPGEKIFYQNEKIYVVSKYSLHGLQYEM